MYFRYDRACYYSPMFFPQEPNPIQTYIETRQGFLVCCGQPSNASCLPIGSIRQGWMSAHSLIQALSLSFIWAEKVTHKRQQDEYFHGLPSSRSILASPRASGTETNPGLEWSVLPALQFGGSVSGDGPFGSRIPSDGLTCSPRPTMLWLVDSDAPILRDSACLGEPFPDGF